MGRLQLAFPHFFQSYSFFQWSIKISEEVARQNASDETTEDQDQGVDKQHTIFFIDGCEYLKS